MKERTSQTIAQLNLHTRLSSASIADVRETGSLKSRTFMRPHTKSVLLKHLNRARAGIDHVLLEAPSDGQAP